MGSVLSFCMLADRQPDATSIKVKLRKDGQRFAKGELLFYGSAMVFIPRRGYIPEGQIRWSMEDVASYRFLSKGFGITSATCTYPISYWEFKGIGDHQAALTSFLDFLKNEQEAVSNSAKSSTTSSQNSVRSFEDTRLFANGLYGAPNREDYWAWKPNSRKDSFAYVSSGVQWAALPPRDFDGKEAAGFQNVDHHQQTGQNCVQGYNCENLDDGSTKTSPPKIKIQRKVRFAIQPCEL